MINEMLETLLEGKDLCISVPDTEKGRMISAFINDYRKEHQDEFEKCSVINVITRKKTK